MSRLRTPEKNFVSLAWKVLIFNLFIHLSRLILSYPSHLISLFPVFSSRASICLNTTDCIDTLPLFFRSSSHGSFTTYSIFPSHITLSRPAYHRIRIELTNTESELYGTAALPLLYFVLLYSRVVSLLVYFQKISYFLLGMAMMRVACHANNRTNGLLSDFEPKRTATDASRRVLRQRPKSRFGGAWDEARASAAFYMTDCRHALHRFLCR